MNRLVKTRTLLISFFFNDTATTEIYTLSLHDALPICHKKAQKAYKLRTSVCAFRGFRSEEHTSELQSLAYLVCRLLLEKKINTTSTSDRWRAGGVYPALPHRPKHG